MIRYRVLTCLALFMTSFMISPVSALAYETRIINGPSGKSVFELRFFDENEEYGHALSESAGEISRWQLSTDQKNAIAAAAELWAEILEPGAKNSTPAPINVGTMDYPNADAVSVSNPAWKGGVWENQTGLGGALIGNQSMDPPAQIRVGMLNFTIAPPTSLPSGNGIDMVGTLYHEIAHALGIASFATTGESYEGETLYGFDADISAWDLHLVDGNGNSPTLDMQVLRPDEIPDDDDPVFIVGDFQDSGVTFRGEHVTEVLAGALGNGLPIEGFEGEFLDLSHIELDRSLMSHQTYRNYQNLMEAELAALQDIGHSIDRKNFYGFSVYGDGLTLSNNNGYFARNEAGTAYLPGQANTATLGVGLHIYGSGNAITQTADIMAGGKAAMGIRLDGEANTLRIAPGVNVFADGPQGTALLTAYGKNQNVISQGNIQALGKGGVGARFDFGGSLLGLDSGLSAEYRGSYIRSLAEAYPDDNDDIQINFYEKHDMLDELAGPLAERFDVSGALTGSAAAIYISRNAWVKNINILNGAFLGGDIISEWNPNNSEVQSDVASSNGDDLLTRLTFGLSPDATGSAMSAETGAADPNFNLRYDGNILGADSVLMSVNGGKLIFNGQAEVLEVTVKEGASLGGNADYILSSAGSGTFTNAGTLSPGNSLGPITIDSDYHQSATGNLYTEFDASGASDKLIVNGGASMNGKITFAPLPDYYTSSIVITPVTATSGISGSYSTELVFTSPTLEMSASDQGGGISHIDFSRPAGAYSRYAANGNAAAVGEALFSASKVREDMRKLYAALDFSAPDGSGVRGALSQLSPQAYAHAALANLDMQRLLSDLILPGLYSRPRQGDGQWQAFVQPYAGTLDQPGHGGTAGYNANNTGIIGGAVRSTPDGLTVGGHAVFNHQSMNGDINGRLSGEGLYLGGQGLYAPAAWKGWNVFATGRVGVESWRMRRTVSWNGYTRGNNSAWTSASGSIRAGGGYEADFGSIKAGPFAALDYAASYRPALTESGGMGSRLHLDSALYHSLRTSLGARLTVGGDVPGGPSTWQGHASAAWNHELLARAGTNRAAFVEAANTAFSGTVKAPGRDSLSLGAGVSFTTGNVSVALDMGSELLRRDGTALYGNFTLRWKF